MKVTVNVDCSPEEARTFFGLPDVVPIQEEMMKAMRKKMMDSFEMMEPEKAMRAWAPMMNQGMGQMSDFFQAVMSGTGAGIKKKK